MMGNEGNGYCTNGMSCRGNEISEEKKHERNNVDENRISYACFRDRKGIGERIFSLFRRPFLDSII
jgi:hypothetical protein